MFVWGKTRGSRWWDGAVGGCGVFTPRATEVAPRATEMILMGRAGFIYAKRRPLHSVVLGVEKGGANA